MTAEEASSSVGEFKLSAEQMTTGEASSSSGEFKRSAGEASSVGEFKRDELAYGNTAGDADEFLKQAKRKFLGRVVQVRNLRSKFCLPLYTAPDGHKIRNLSALTPGELVQITEVRTSSDLSRVAGRTVLPNPDSPEDCLWVNLWSKFNLHGEQPRNGVWYVQRPS